MEADRAREMQTSEQLTLGELTLKLEAVSDKSLPIEFDYQATKPTGLASWRGSYRELAIQYEDGGATCYELPGPDCLMDDPPFARDHSYRCPCGGRPEHSTSLPETPTTQDLLDVLKLAHGKFFTGYKGGDFTMGKTTPVWVANYGNSSGFGDGSMAVVEVREEKENGRVVLVTKHLD